MQKEEFKWWIKALDVDFDECVKDIQSFMTRLLHSGIDPSYVSLEGYRYTEAFLETYASMLHTKKLRKEVAATLLEEAARQTGISADQLIAAQLEHSTKAEA